MERDRVVVGVDGSPGSILALRWALGDARRRDADVEVVMCWHPPYMVEASGYGLGYLTEEELTADARATLEACLNEVEPELAAAREGGLRVSTALIEGSPGPTLVTESKGAALLVVGRHGRISLAHWLLGSVSRHVAEHAHCPVVIAAPVHND